MVDVSVIIVSYNTKALLRQCLDSALRSLKLLRAGDGLRSYEITVVDNASWDGSPEMVRECFPEVTLLQPGRNLGFAAGNNLAIQKAAGRYLLFLNPDTVVVRDALSELVDFMDNHPSAGVATGCFIYPDGSLQDGAFSFPGLWGTFLDFFPFSHRLIRSKLNGRYPPRAYSGPFEIDYPLGACFIVRRDVICQVGAFEEDFFLYCEEVEWCWRIKKAGWKVFCDPGPAIIHYGGQSTRQRRDDTYLQLHRSRLLFFKKHYSPLFCALNRILVATGSLWEALGSFLEERKGEQTRAGFAERTRTCLKIFSMAVKGV